MKNDVPNLIECGDHKWAPWAIVCIHLLENPTTTEWIPLENNRDGREVDFDYICPWCDDKVEELGSWDKMLDYLRPVCIHCVRHLRKKAGLEES